jgi:hypothetical protein
MAEDIEELYAMIVEGPQQDPILWETEGKGFSLDVARKRLSEAINGGLHGRYFRGCVVQLVFAEGNRAVLHAAASLRDGPEMRDNWRIERDRKALNSAHARIQVLEQERDRLLKTINDNDLTIPF